MCNHQPPRSRASMHSSIAHITILALLIHAGFGCCWHHAHDGACIHHGAARATGKTADACTSMAVGCDHHHSTEFDRSVQGSFRTRPASSGSDNECDCDGEDCKFVPTRHGQIRVSDVGWRIQLSSSPGWTLIELMSRRGTNGSDARLSSSRSAMRAHLCHCILQV